MIALGIGAWATPIEVDSPLQFQPGIKGAVELTFQSEVGYYYQLEISTDLVEWDNEGYSIKGTGGVLTILASTRNLPSIFFRLRNDGDITNTAPVGPQGPRGEQGPAGPSGFLYRTIYESVVAAQGVAYNVSSNLIVNDPPAPEEGASFVVRISQGSARIGDKLYTEGEWRRIWQSGKWTTNRIGFTGAQDADVREIIGAADVGLMNAEARATLAKIRSYGRTRVGFIGDSITAGNSAFSANLGLPKELQDSPALYAVAQGDGAWQLVVTAGIGGQRSDQIAARIANDVLSQGVDICVIVSCYWNNIGQGRTLQKTHEDLVYMVETCLAAGVLPVLCTPTPDGASTKTTSRLTKIAHMRRLVGHVGRSYSIPVVDLHRPIADPVTGSIRATFSSTANDVHPNSAGRAAIGAVLGKAITSLIGGKEFGGDMTVCSGAGDELFAGFGFFALDANSDGVSDGWQGPAVGQRFVWSRAVHSTFGYVQRCVTTGSTSNTVITRQLSGLSPGSIIEVSGRLGKSGSSQAQLAIITSGGNFRVTWLGTAPDVSVENGAFFSRFRVPPGVTMATVHLLVGSGTGSVEFANISARDLSAFGYD